MSRAYRRGYAGNTIPSLNLSSASVLTSIYFTSMWSEKGNEWRETYRCLLVCFRAV